MAAATIGGLTGAAAGVLLGLGALALRQAFLPAADTGDVDPSMVSFAAFFEVLGYGLVGGLTGITLGTGIALAVRGHRAPWTTALLVPVLAVVLVLVPFLGPLLALASPAVARLLRVRLPWSPIVAPPVPHAGHHQQQRKDVGRDGT